MAPLPKLALWLCLALGLLVLPASAEQIVISEIMYHPSGTKPEYIEIKNVSWNPRDIALWKLTSGVSLTLPDFNAGAPQDVFIKPQERIILSSADAATTRTAYGISGSTRVFGPWVGSLDNSGEQVTLQDKNGVTMATVKYGSSGNWSRAADGTGHSLMIINENSDPDDWRNWKASPQTRGGSTSTIVVNYGDTWKWNIPSSDPGSGWQAIAYNDGSWGSGPGLFGYETALLPPPQIQTGLASGNVTFLFRKTFTYSGSTTGATVSIDQILDDGVIYYLNGNVIGMSRMSTGLAWNANALTQVGDAAEEAAAVTGPATGLVVGTNVLCAEVHNFGAGSSDMVFGARMTISSGGALNNTTLRLSESHFGANGHLDWVELQNPSTTSAQSAVGLYVASKADLSDRVALSGSVAANAFGSWALDFTPDASGDVVLYLADASNNVLGTAGLTYLAGRSSIQAVWPVTPSSKPTWELTRTKPEWYSSPTATQNAANNPPITNSIVINEIMCDPLSDQTQAEYLELFNKTGAPVSLAGWKLRGGISFDFPAGTTIAANGYLVVGGSKSTLQSVYGGATIVGDWSGSLGNKGDLIQLKDQYDNLADEVDYHTGGDWPDLSMNKGSSMELINPNMDNNRASAWRASDESNKSTFATYTANLGPWLDILEWNQWGGGAEPYLETRRDRAQLTTNPEDYKEWHFFAVKDAHIILKNITLTPSSGGGNQLQNVGQMTPNGNTNSGWLAQGTHGQSTIDAAGLHLIADGHGDGTLDNVEIDCTGISQGTSYTITFDARWVSGVPVIMGQTWDRSIGSVFRISVPNNLGTAGAVNSRNNSNVPPQVDSVLHSPAVPTSSQSVKITARVYSQSGVGSVEAMVRQDDINNANAYSPVAMVDNGTGGDAVAGDGVYTATITNHQVDGRQVQFYVRATANNGQQAVDPPDGGARPAMWRVDNRTVASDLGRRRFVMSAYDLDALVQDGAGHPKAKYNYKYPRMNNHYFPVTFIYGESEVYYLCEARQGGSQWHRSTDMSNFDRIKWKMPDDRHFRKHQKLYINKDSVDGAGLENGLSLYQAYLLGYPACNELELTYVMVNGYPINVRTDTELTENDLLRRAFNDHGEGQLVKTLEQLTVRDDYANILYAPSDLSYAYRGSDNPTFWHGSFPLRSREMDFDYSSLTELFKTWSNPSAPREQLDRIIDVDEFTMIAAVRGYAGDTDSLTYIGKNTYFYKRASDNRWLNLHWDGAAGFQENNQEAHYIIRDVPGLKEFLNRPWVRRQFNFYLSEIVQKWSKNSSRVGAWFTAQQNAAGAAFTYGAPNYLPSPSRYTTFFNNQESYAQNMINSNVGTGGAGGAYSAGFTVNSPGSGGSTSNATVNLSGTAPSSAYAVEVVGHPETVLNWANQTTWTLDGLVLKTGSNSLTLRMVDRAGVQTGSTINWTITKTGNAAPVMDLKVNPGSYNVILGQTLTLDAAASYDPDAGALTFGWSNNPGSGVVVTTPVATPANSKRQAVFSSPGIYSFTVTGTDPGSANSSISREVAVAAAGDFESFSNATLDPAVWTAIGISAKNATPASRWYSLSDNSGSLVMQVMDNSAKALSYANNQPTLMRNMPASADCAILTELSLQTRKTGTFFTGLYLETVESGAVIRYAFGLDDGTHISAKRMTSGGISTLPHRSRPSTATRNCGFAG